jgi:hypothetical protein
VARPTTRRGFLDWAGVAESKKRVRQNQENLTMAKMKTTDITLETAERQKAEDQTMAKMKTTDITFETTERQKKYVAEQEAKGGGLGLVFADAFLRGMRDIGYKDTAWAMCEEVDNSVQAGATIIGVRFGYAKDNKKKARPDLIAVIDNGVGMIPKMIGYAVRWGGTDREDNRQGFGRYGYGLPSSAVSFCKVYTVYSKVKGGDWHAVRVSIDELAAAASDFEKTNQLLQPRRLDPPAWAMEKWTVKHSNDKEEDGGSVDAPEATVIDPGTFESGTVIVHEDLDRLEWAKTSTIKTKLLQRFGVNYRHWLPSPKIVVDDTVTDPVDPLFLMENCRYYDATSVLAQRIETKTFEIETARGTKGSVKIRAAYLPPNFQLDPPDQPISKVAGLRGSKLHQGRFEIMRDYNGLLICREGRQIDCIQPRWTKFQVYDRNVKIEIDFDPELDEFFGITTAKQQIGIDDVLWDKLESDGGGNVRKLVRDIRDRRDEDEAKLKGKEDTAAGKDAPRASEKVMEETEKFKPRADKPSDRKKAKAREELETTATAIAETTGRAREEVLGELEERTAKRRFEVEFQSIPEGPFYRPKRFGEQKRLIINTLHPFYTKVYDATPEIKAALEVLLFVLAEAELEAEGDQESFYRSARGGWSERLYHALNELRPDEDMRDKAAAVAEKMQLAAAEG